jgi:hypothetical protein
MRSTKLGDASDRILGLFGKLLRRREEVHGLGSMAFGRLAVQKFLNIECFLH